MPEELAQLRDAQDAAMNKRCGGNDLVKIDLKQLLIIAKQMSNREALQGLMKYEETFESYDGSRLKAVFPLVQNPNAIICVEEKDDKKYHYFDSKTKEFRITQCSCMGNNAVLRKANIVRNQNICLPPPSLRLN